MQFEEKQKKILTDISVDGPSSSQQLHQLRHRCLCNSALFVQLQKRKGRLDERRGRERRNKERLSCRRLCVCVVRWRVSRHQREIQQTFKGTAQWGVLARRWFGQLAYLLTQPRLTVRRKATEASTATSKTQTGRLAAGKSHSRVYRTFRMWQVWILTMSPPSRTGHHRSTETSGLTLLSDKSLTHNQRGWRSLPLEVKYDSISFLVLHYFAFF